MDNNGLIYKLMDVKYPQTATKVIHYDRLKPYRCATDRVPMDVTQAVLPPSMVTLPRYIQ